MRIGVDLGGTKIEAVLLDEAGQIVVRKRVAAPSNDYQLTLDAIVALVTEIEMSIAQQQQPLSVGIGTPGATSRKTGLMKNSNNNCLNDKPLREDLAKALQRNVAIANDANCFALSEAMDGAGQDGDVVFGVIIGTGVGGGLCVSKKLLNGINSISGEWGHNPLALKGSDVGFGVDPGSARKCSCGKLDCVETWLSGPAFQSTYHAASGRELIAQDIVKLAENGDKIANLVLDQYSRILALALSTVINIVDPDIIVLGGGLSNIDRLYEDVPKHWGDYVFSDQVETKLVKAKFGDSSGVRGAAWL